MRMSRPLENRKHRVNPSVPSHAIKNLWTHGREVVTRHWRTTLRMSTLYIVMLRRKRRGSTRFAPGKLAGTIHPATMETFGANDDVQPGRTSIRTRCFHGRGAPTQTMESDDVPQGVRRSYSCLYPSSMWACGQQEQSTTSHKITVHLSLT